ncbi:MAG: 50S ribosomal protein L25 [Candidatus Omnitrophica bacterium]|nr:50S ribosomal protein L25 [Candidatus Omnitrophota bacterium]MDD5488197.1 50S ribosomal protein L25 [Candidatus Omnitrophota bacterium]
MEKIMLKAEIREELGKSAAHHVRKEGKVPAVIYKDGQVGVNVQVDNRALWHAVHTEAGENAIITLNISGNGAPESKTVIVQDIQTDPLNDTFVHVDFHEISLTEKIKVNIPVAVKGESVGVKDEDGVLTQTIWEIEVECLPTDIPEHINIDVTGLAMGDAIHVSDVPPIPGVKILEDPETVIVSVHHHEAEPEEEAATTVEGEEPELIKKGKKEEEGAEGEEPAE